MAYASSKNPNKQQTQMQPQQTMMQIPMMDIIAPPSKLQEALAKKIRELETQFLKEKEKQERKRMLAETALEVQTKIAQQAEAFAKELLLRSAKDIDKEALVERVFALVDNIRDWYEQAINAVLRQTDLDPKKKEKIRDALMRAVDKKSVAVSISNVLQKLAEQYPWKKELNEAAKRIGEYYVLGREKTGWWIFKKIIKPRQEEAIQDEIRVILAKGVPVTTGDLPITPPSSQSKRGGILDRALAGLKKVIKGDKNKAEVTFRINQIRTAIENLDNIGVRGADRIYLLLPKIAFSKKNERKSWNMNYWLQRDPDIQRIYQEVRKLRDPTSRDIGENAILQMASALAWLSQSDISDKDFKKVLQEAGILSKRKRR
ncbi:MAG: hypothetical protein Q6363_007860 [Candidatus Njordarchaeota archaeon]